MSFQGRLLLHLATNAPIEKVQRVVPARHYYKPEQATIHAELATMRQAFHNLLDELDECDLQQRNFAISVLSVGELLTYCITSVAVIPQELANIRAGENFYHWPAWLFNLLQIVRTRFVAHRATRTSLAHKWDAAVVANLAALATVHDHEWQEGAYLYNEGYWTIERIFTQQPHQFAKHAATIRQILAGNKSRAQQMVAELS